MVGRPRQFDENQVLDQAMTVFWTNGYEATSMADLMNATGLHKGSLYQAFGNKHQLFVTALNRYLEEMRAQKNRLLKAAASPWRASKRCYMGCWIWPTRTMPAPKAVWPSTPW